MSTNDGICPFCGGLFNQHEPDCSRDAAFEALNAGFDPSRAVGAPAGMRELLDVANRVATQLAASGYTPEKDSSDPARALLHDALAAVAKAKGEQS